MRIECANNDVQIAIVECGARFGAKARLAVLDGIEHAKCVEDLSGRPDRVVALPSMTGAFAARTAMATVAEDARVGAPSPGERTVAICCWPNADVGSGKRGDEKDSSRRMT